MKKIFICLLTCLLFTQIYVKDTLTETNTVYESDDFEIDKIYHFKTGDVVKFSDGNPFEIIIIDENGREAEDVEKEYTFKKDINAYIYNYSTSDDDHYLRLHRTYDITYNLMGKGENFVSSTKSYYYSSDNHTEFFAFLPPVPTYPNYMFDVGI